MSDYEFKNNNKYNITTLIIKEDFSPEDFDQFLKKTISRLKSYFKNLGVIVDVSAIKNRKDFNESVNLIKSILLNNNFLLMGFCGAKGSQKDFLNTELKAPVIPVNSKNKTLEDNLIGELSIIKTEEDSNKKEVFKEKEKETKEKQTENTSLINLDNQSLGLQKHFGIVRGGAKIYAENKSLIIFGSVNPNAEVFADGDIIIFGSLKGKAVAGANGNKNAVIMATEFKPSIISIAGLFLTFDEENDSFYGVNKKLSLKNEELIIEEY